MKTIGEELHWSTEAFKILESHSSPPNILDMCMAPGGFLRTALSKNVGSRALAVSLPVKDDGHMNFLPRYLIVKKRFLDVTMLAANMDMEEIDGDHPDVENFLPRQFGSHQLFDLVICDALGLQHLRPGGTIIVLHKIEAWDTANLIRKFCKFSSVRVFKPEKGHAERSSFYMVATNTQSQGPDAVRAVERWKGIWRVSTFGTDEEYQKMLWNVELPAEDFLKDFGPELVALGGDIWKVQSEALANAPFIK